MRFKLFGTEIEITFLFSSLLVLLLLTDRTGLASYLFLSVSAHEAAHLAAMWMLDCSPKRLRLKPAAVEILSPPMTSGKEEAIITLAGPACNLLLFLTFWLNSSLFRSGSALLFSLVNLLIGGFNLLPVAGLDGGTLLQLLITRFFGADKARLVLRLLGVTMAATGIIFGFSRMIRGAFNPTILLAGLYILVMTLMKL